MEKHDPGEGIIHGSNLELGDTGPFRPFTPEQEKRIREIIFAMTHLALEDYYVRQGKPAISVLADDFWREPDGSIPPEKNDAPTNHKARMVNVASALLVSIVVVLLLMGIVGLGGHALIP